MGEVTCRICGLPMRGGPSMGGPDICSWCDCGGAERRFRMEYELQKHRADGFAKALATVARMLEAKGGFGDAVAEIRLVLRLLGAADTPQDTPDGQ